MERSELKIIQELMEKLCDEMEYSPEDFEGRLGRNKPDVSIVKVEGKGPMLEEAEEGLGDEEMGEEMAMSEDDPEESFKQRVMKLRG
jgi:hypothetical protein